MSEFAKQAKPPKTRIFIVDDEMYVRKYIGDILDVLNCILVGHAENADDFTRQLDDIDADLILMDICLPGMDGKQLLSVVKSKRPDLNIAMLTSRNTIEIIKECKELGAIGYILKRGSVLDVAENISKVISRIHL